MDEGLKDRIVTTKDVASVIPEYAKDHGLSKSDLRALRFMSQAKGAAKRLGEIEAKIEECQLRGEAISPSIFEIRAMEQVELNVSQHFFEQVRTYESEGLTRNPVGFQAQMKIDLGKHLGAEVGDGLLAFALSDLNSTPQAPATT